MVKQVNANTAAVTAVVYDDRKGEPDQAPAPRDVPETPAEDE